MIGLLQIEEDLKSAMKAKNQIAMDVLRGLKTRLQNERIAKTRDLTEDDILALVRSEIKKRKEAAESFKTGGRLEMAEKEVQEILVLEKYLPAAMPEAEILKAIEEAISQNQFTAQDFGKAMGLLKTKLGNTVDGSTIARLLKDRLK